MIANSGHDERGKYSGGSAGDQGGEWVRQEWYNRPWHVVLRHPSPWVGSLIAQLAGEAADNDRIGYDQSQRTTFWHALKAADYFPRMITTACEADCSAGVAAIVKAIGYILGIEALKSVSADMYTGNERQALTSAGFQALTEQKYLTGPGYLLPGDVLLCEGHHTAINLDKGSKTDMPTYTVEKHIAATAAFAKTAQAGGYVHGDSKTLPPCIDHITACDRGAVARPLWDLGYTDQPAGGITVVTMESWLSAHGWKKVTRQQDLIRGDIVLMKKKGETKPSADWHTFLIVSYDKIKGFCSKYDFGSTERIRSGAYFQNRALNEWVGSKEFYCAFRYGGGTLKISPDTLKLNTTSPWAYTATEILKARGFKGILDKQTGKRKSLELNFKWTIGDMSAMIDYKLQRTINGTNLAKGPYGGGEIGPDDWVDLFGGPLPFELLELPAQQTKGPCVLLLQEKLRARGFKTAEGNPLPLDRIWSIELELAFRKYQKISGEPNPDGKVTAKWWKLLCGIS